MPKISVIIPVYNAEKYLNKTLESILKQSLKDIEVICVDDGSTDSSVEIIQSFIKKDDRVKLIRQNNQHAGSARNTGLKGAQGEYIHFMDADDYVLNYAYEAIYNKVIKYDLDCLKFSSVVYDVKQKDTVDLPAFTLTRLRPGDFNRLLTLEAGSPIYKVNVAPWNGVYRRTFLEKNNIVFNTLFCVNDRSFFNKVITNAERMMIARDRLVVHRVNMKESLVGKRAEHFDCHFRSIEIVSDQLVADEVDEEIKLLIMQKEFKDLFAWYVKFADDSVLGQRIKHETEAFVKSYQGLYPELLYKAYKEACRIVFNGVVVPEEPEILKIWQKRCDKPKVSVVLPIYNVEDYLNEALYSLTIQSLHEMEFICVNDGSTDGSMAIIKEYASLDKRFRIIDKPNSGYGHSMNKGIDAARGQYLGILEPDDFVPSSMFRALYRIASRNNLDFVKADFYRFTVNEDGSLRKRRFSLTDKQEYYNCLIDPSENIETFKFIMNTWSGIYSLDFLNKYHIRHNETPGASYQDNGFWFQTFCRAKRAWFVNKPYYMNRRDNPNSSMFNRQKVYCVTEEYRYIWDWMSKEPELIKKYSAIFYMKKYSNFMVTYRRIAEPLRMEYLHHICDEFRKPMQEGKLDEELFGPAFWKQINEILADPEAYYAKVRVSVIIPVYNAEKYIRQCLDSLLVQNNQRIEVICVDDGSTDNSLAILKEYEEAHQEVKVITQKNAGAGAARNNGMKYATGEYLSFLDADDFFEPDMLYRAYLKASVNESDIVAFRSDQYLEGKKVFAGAQYTINTNLLPLEQPFAGLDIEQDIFKAFVGWAWDKLFRTEFVRETGLQFQEQRTSNDMYFVFCSIIKAKSIETMNAVMAHHRRDEGSLSVTREQSWECFYHALCAVRDQLKEWNLYDQIERDFVNYAQHFTLWNLTTLKGASYFKLYKKIQEEWAADLGITGRDADYFYNEDEYEEMQTVLNSTPEEFLFYRMDMFREQLDKANSTANGLRSKIGSLNNDVKNLTGEKEVLKQEKQQLKKQNEEIRNNLVWKVGKKVSRVPSKLKSITKNRK